jgi:hypothetical protein
MGDIQYRNLIIAIMNKLEPCQVKGNTILINELDEFMSVIFFMKGMF